MYYISKVLLRVSKYLLDLGYGVSDSRVMARNNRANWEDKILLDTNMAIRCGKPHRAIWNDVAAHTGMSISQIILRTSLEFIKLAKQGKVDVPLGNYIHFAFGGKK